MHCRNRTRKTEVSWVAVVAWLTRTHSGLRLGRCSRRPIANPPCHEVASRHGSSFEKRQILRVRLPLDTCACRYAVGSALPRMKQTPNDSGWMIPLT